MAIDNAAITESIYFVEIMAGATRMFVHSITTLFTKNILGALLTPLYSPGPQRISQFDPTPFKCINKSMFDPLGRNAS